MDILAIQGSLGTPSRTGALVELAEEILVGWGHRVHVFDLREHSLPWVDPDRHGDLSGQGDRSVRLLVDLAVRADAHIWASPVYHNSYSGVLKCALDHLAMPQLADKPVALCGATVAGPAASSRWTTCARWPAASTPSPPRPSSRPGPPTSSSEVDGTSWSTTRSRCA